MEMIEEQVSPALKNALKKLDINYFLTSDNQLINHRVFYCNTWDDAKNKEGLAFIELLKSECDHLKTSFEKCTLIQVNIINAPPDCNNQLFHIDYRGDSFSYFIPFVELSDLNGTEYLHFSDEKNYTKYYETLLQMSDEYLNKPDIVDYLSRHAGLKLEQDFCFKCANSDAFSLLYMPYYTYHRGQKNKTTTPRLMLNVLFSIGNNFNYPTEEYILDAEIDEMARATQILELRKNNIIV